MFSGRAFQLIWRRAVACNRSNPQVIKSDSLCSECPFPEAPLSETCCGSGCYNCVWIQYADAVHKYFDDHPCIERTPRKWQKIHDLLGRNVPDVNLRAYLEMEMKHKFFH